MDKSGGSTSSSVLCLIFNKSQYDTNNVGSMISGYQRFKLPESFLGSNHQGVLTYCVPCVLVHDVIFADGQNGRHYHRPQNIRSM